MKDNNFYVIAFISLILTSIVFTLTKEFVFLNIYFMTICIVLFFRGSLFVIVCYIVLLPTNGLYSTTYNLFGLFSPLIIVQLFSFMLLLKQTSKDEIRNLNEFQKVAIGIVVALIIFFTYTDFKNAYYKINDIQLVRSQMDFTLAFNRLLKTFFRYGTLILLIVNIKKNEIKSVVAIASKIGVIFLVTTALFTKQLVTLGFDSVNATDNVERVTRMSGFFGWGDVNSLGSFLVIYIGYLLIIKNHIGLKLNDFFAITMCVIGVLYSGSRTAIVGLIFVFAFFLVISKKKIWFIVFGIVILFFINTFFSQQISDIIWRFSTADREAYSTEEGTRLFKWVQYYDYMLKNPDTFIYGSKNEFYLTYSKGFTEKRVPHNLYITLVFDAGILAFSIFTFNILKLLIISFTKWLDLLLIVIPVLFISFYVSDIGYLHYFVLFIPLTSDYISKNIYY